MRRLLLVLALFVAVLVPAVAHGAEGIGVSPAVKELTIEQGQESANFSLNLSNSTNSPVTLRLSTLDFGSLDEAGGIEFIGRTGQETSAFGLKQWMKLELDSVTIAPGESKDVKVTIENEESLEPGGHYGAVIVSAAEEGVEPDSVAVLPAASTLVLLRKNGGEKYELNLDSKKTNSSLISLPKDVSLRFHNTGNIHGVPRGTIELRGPFGSPVAKGVINENSSFVLPQSYREINIQLTNFNQPWLPGRYKLEIAWRYDGKESFETVEYSYWYMGKLPIILLAILCLVIVLKLYKNYKSWDK